jgi:hypothetical protein
MQVYKWCLYIYFWRDGFVIFMCFDQGVEFGCHRFYPYQICVLVFVCCVTSVHCLLNVFLKWVWGIFIPGCYSIFLYEGINLLFQFMCFDHGSTLICLLLLGCSVTVEFLFVLSCIAVSYVMYYMYSLQ